MTCPFYRSRLFWLGLPGLVFLLWFWLIFSPKGIYINAGPRGGSILSFRSAIEFTFSDDSSRPKWEVGVLPLEEENDRIDFSDPVFKRDYQVWSGESCAVGRSLLTFSRMDYLSMRPWLPSVAYLRIWLGVVWGWQFRKSRLLKLHTSP